ncbi:AzlD domain-containing protein [Salinisphaera sp. USBA-960]|uniref:AzlD domain-containing protein n=1 Tax=Salinisphaera orenii TaxID=856731 RepID=UPI000DBE29CA|nr:AzlD domain-containing protein [Salifodinibacter halophilus]NNC25743.1 AzlD domain-containing protein [Salifodinibacter halophilus]
MNGVGLWLTIVVAGVATYLLRWSFLGFLGRYRMPDVVAEALDFVPPAVLAAIVVPAVVSHDSGALVSIFEPRLWAAVIAGVVAWRTRSIFYTIVVGMAALWLLIALGA